MHDQITEARRILTGLGLHEAQGQTLISDTTGQLTGTGNPVRLANPLSSDMNVLRPSLLPGLLDSLRHNLSHKIYDVPLFEIGRVFQTAAGDPPPGARQPEPGSNLREERRIAIALTGQRRTQFWSGEERDAKFDFYDLKGVLEEFFEQFGLRALSYVRRGEKHATLPRIRHDSSRQTRAR